MKLNYAFQPTTDKSIARASGKDLNVSLKHTIMLCGKLRNMMLNDAILLLEKVIKFERAIEFTRFNKGIGHRRGTQAKVGKYPKKAAHEILNILQNLQSNADFKGLDLENLRIVHIQAQKGVARRRRKPKGRYKLWRSQLVHVQVIAEEI